MEVEESQRRLNLVGPQVDMPSVSNPSITIPNPHWFVQLELTAAAIHRVEQIRLQRIHCQIQMIYQDGRSLAEVVGAMIEELDSVEVQDILQ